MSTSQPLPIQVSLPAKTGTTAVSSQAESLDADSNGVFGGVLSGELDSAGSLEEATATVELQDTVNPVLPLDGNSLPINSELTIDIESLEANVDKLGLDITDAAVDISALEQLEAVIANPVIPSVTSKDFSATSDLALRQADIAKPENVIRFVNNTGLVPSKAEASTQLTSLLPFSDSSIDAETQAVTQFKESLQSQKSLSPLIKQIDFSQIGRVLEQFSEFNQKSVAPPAPSLSTTLNPSPLSTTTSATSISVAQLSVEVPVQDQRWQKAFSQRVIWSVGNVQSAQLRLNPAELGRIDIQVNIDNDKASVVFNAQNGVVKEAIEQALPRLKEMLAEQGVELEKAEIFNENFNQQQTSAQNDSSKNQDSEADAWSGIPEDELLDGTHASQITLNDDIVDYYV